MPRYLFRANYTVEGLHGLLEEGGTGRREAVERMAESLGGAIEAFEYAFGQYDVYVLSELPDDEAATALSLRVAATGKITLDTVKLLSAEQVDEAVSRELEYRAPGDG